MVGDPADNGRLTLALPDGPRVPSGVKAPSAELVVLGSPLKGTGLGDCSHPPVVWNSRIDRERNPLNSG